MDGKIASGGQPTETISPVKESRSKRRRRNRRHKKGHSGDHSEDPELQSPVEEVPQSAEKPIEPTPNSNETAEDSKSSNKSIQSTKSDGVYHIHRPTTQNHTIVVNEARKVEVEASAACSTVPKSTPANGTSVGNCSEKIDTPPKSNAVPVVDSKTVKEEKSKKISIESKKEEKPPENDISSNVQTEDAKQKSKSELRAERRAKQEAQRAAKAERMVASGKGPKVPTKKPEDSGAAKEVKTHNKPITKEGVQNNVENRQAKSDDKKLTGKDVAVVCGSQNENTTPPVQAKNEEVDETDQRKDSGIVRVSVDVRHDDPQQVKKRMKKLEKQKLHHRAEVHKKVSLFAHLPQYKIENDTFLPPDWKAGSSPVHAAFFRIGVRMAYGSLRGANLRCIALAEALISFIDNYERDEDKEFARHLESLLSPNLTFLTLCRPLTAGMRTLVKNFKASVSSIGREETLTDAERKVDLKKMVEDFIEEKVVLASEAIAKNASKMINDGDCLLTYAFSSTVSSVLEHAWKTDGRRFQVIVADCEPWFEGRRMIRFLEGEGIPCEYVSLSGVPLVMGRVTRVFLGAQALFNNGSVLARAGTGLVANVSQEFHHEVHVCCESYKFWERGQLDSFVYNELADPSVLVDPSMRTEWEDPKSPIHYLLPVYDVTPAEFVNTVITELCVMPGSSVPVVLRRNTAYE